MSSLPILTFHALDDQSSVISFRPDVFRDGMRMLHARGFETGKLPTSFSSHLSFVGPTPFPFLNRPCSTELTSTATLVGREVAETLTRFYSAEYRNQTTLQSGLALQSHITRIPGKQQNRPRWTQKSESPPGGVPPSVRTQKQATLLIFKSPFHPHFGMAEEFTSIITVYGSILVPAPLDTHMLKRRRFHVILLSFLVTKTLIRGPTSRVGQERWEYGRVDRRRETQNYSS